MPHLERHGTDPVSGDLLKGSALLRLHFSRNPSGEFYCPITLKTFTEHSRIVANRKSGNVYSAEGIEGMEVMKDYFTDEPFTKADLLTLQDPQTIKNIGDFAHIRKAKEDATKLPVKPQEITPTDSALTETTKGGRVPSEEELLEKMLTTQRGEIKRNGKATIRTNFGDLHLELYCQRTPRTCYNFITLAKRGYYETTRFHRLIPAFMLQGGDPSGTGRGGESCWGKPFADEIHPQLKHSERGILAMANSGTPKSNGSQFFITFAAAPHLDGAHTVFGKVIGGEATLNAIERIPTDANNRPQQPIIIHDVIVVEDPFAEWIKAQMHVNRSHGKNVTTDPTLVVRKAKAQLNTASTIGRYLKKPPSSK